MNDSDGKIYFTDFIDDLEGYFELTLAERISGDQIQKLRGRLTLVLSGGYEGGVLSQISSILGLIVETQDADEIYKQLDSLLESAGPGEVVISFDPFEKEAGQPINFLKRTIVRKLTTGEKAILDAEKAKKKAIFNEAIERIFADVGLEWMTDPEEPKGNN